MAACPECGGSEIVQLRPAAGHESSSPVSHEFIPRGMWTGVHSLELFHDACLRCGLMWNRVSAYQLRNILWESGKDDARAAVDRAGGPYTD